MRPLLLTLLALASLAAPGRGLAQTAMPRDKHGDWAVFVEQAAGGQVCFIAAKPQGKEQPVLYVSAWPQDGVKAEVSAWLGYAAKKGSDTLVTLSGTTFRLFPAGERSFVKDPTQELKLIEAMKKGNKLTLSAVAEKGTAAPETISLNGFNQALQAMAAACP